MHGGAEGDEKLPFVALPAPTGARGTLATCCTEHRIARMPAVLPHTQLAVSARVPHGVAVRAHSRRAMRADLQAEVEFLERQQEVAGVGAVFVGIVGVVRLLAPHRVGCVLRRFRLVPVNPVHREAHHRLGAPPTATRSLSCAPAPHALTGDG